MDPSAIRRRLEIVDLDWSEATLNRARGRPTPSRASCLSPLEPLLHPDEIHALSEEPLWGSILARMALARATATLEDARDPGGGGLEGRAGMLAVQHQRDRHLRLGLARELQSRLEAVRFEDGRWAATLHEAGEPWGGWAALVSQALGLELSSLVDEARSFLKGSTDLHRDVIRDLAGRWLSLKPDQAAWHDLAHLLHFSGAASEFPRSWGVVALRTSLSRSGLDEGARGRISIHPAANRFTRPSTAVAVDRSGVVGVVLPDGEGPRYWAALFRGLGKAIALAQTDPRLSFEARRGHSELGLAARGAIIEGLMGNPVWLKRALKSARGGELARMAWVYWLCRQRAQCAHLVSAFELFTSESEAQWREEADDLLTQALGRPEPRHRPASFEGGAPLLGAWIAIDGADRLREAFDEDWFHNPRAGKDLAGRARRGADGLAEELPEETPEVSNIVRRFEAALA